MKGSNNVAAGVGDDRDVCGGKTIAIETDLLVGLQGALKCCFSWYRSNGHVLRFFDEMEYFD